MCFYYWKGKNIGRALEITQVEHKRRASREVQCTSRCTTYTSTWTGKIDRQIPTKSMILA
jgi:hypothetical protein